MADRTLILITGANQGLGYYATQQLAAENKYHVLLGSRDPSKASSAIETLEKEGTDVSHIEPLQIDVTSDDSIFKAVKTVEEKYGKLDILVNNAGITGGMSNGPEETRDHWRRAFDTNLFGASVVTEAFLPLLRKGRNKRIAFTSSGLASLTYAAKPDSHYNARMYLIYRSTKTAMSMMILHYAQTLGDEGFAVVGIDPGYCATNLNGHSGLKDPRDGAKVIVRAATVQDTDRIHGLTITDPGDGVFKTDIMDF